MNTTVALVNEWGDFEEKYPGGSIEEFCRYYLMQKRKAGNEELFEGHMPNTSRVILIKLLGRIMTMFKIYADNALEPAGVRHMEDFLYLNVIFHKKDPKKTEVIYDTMMEVSTGLLNISNLIKKKLITEHEDPDDKRSKRLMITEEGKEVLFKCYETMVRVGNMMFGEIDEQDILLCVQLLKSVDIKFSKLWQQHKGKPLDEILESLEQKHSAA